jgi:glycosyltransferase involved in cell wall biosynthesis
VPGQTGLLVEAANEHALLQAVTQLVENPSERKTFGTNGQARMHESFSIDEMSDRNLAVYESILKKRE